MGINKEVPETAAVGEAAEADAPHFPRDALLAGRTVLR